MIFCANSTGISPLSCRSGFGSAPTIERRMIDPRCHPERHPPRQHLVEHHAERPDVRPVVHRLALGPARATCRRSSRCRPVSASAAVSPCSLASPKSMIFARPVLRHHDVRALDVAVHDALADAPPPDPRQPAPRCPTACSSFQRARCEPVPSGSPPRTNSIAMNGCPSASSISWMVQMFGWLKAPPPAWALPHEPLLGLGLDGQLRRQELEGDRPLELDVLGLIDTRPPSPRGRSRR